MPDSVPLKPRWFHILLALADGPAHGFAIRASVEERTGGALRMWPATLYGSIRELVEAGAIQALEGEDDPDDDQRRRYYELTATGRELLRAEAERLRALADAAYRSEALSRA